MGQKTGGTITGMQKDIVTMIPKNPVILIQKSSGIVSLKIGGQVIYPLRESTLSPVLHSIAFPVTPNLLENPGPVEFSLSRDIVWGWKTPPVIVDFDVASTILRRCDLLYWAVLIGTLIFVMANLMVGLVLTFAEFRYPPSGWLRIGLVIISILLLLSPIVSYIVLYHFVSLLLASVLVSTFPTKKSWPLILLLLPPAIMLGALIYSPWKAFTISPTLLAISGFAYMLYGTYSAYSGQPEAVLSTLPLGSAMVAEGYLLSSTIPATAIPTGILFFAIGSIATESINSVRLWMAHRPADSGQIPPVLDLNEMQRRMTNLSNQGRSFTLLMLYNPFSYIPLEELLPLIREQLKVSDAIHLNPTGILILSPDLLPQEGEFVLRRLISSLALAKIGYFPKAGGIHYTPMHAVPPDIEEAISELVQMLRATRHDIQPIKIRQI